MRPIIVVTVVLILLKKPVKMAIIRAEMVVRLLVPWRRLGHVLVAATAGFYAETIQLTIVQKTAMALLAVIPIVRR